MGGMVFAWKPPSCFLLFLLFLFGILTVSAQDAPQIEVEDVRFTRVGGNWLAAVITIRADRDPSPDAIDEDYLDDVRLDFYTCYEVDRGADGDELSFYNSSVRMVSLNRRNSYVVAFFLPGVVRDRDDLDTDPLAWVIRMDAGGREIPLTDDQFGGQIGSRASYDNFMSKANAEGSANDGIFLPIYLTPVYIVNDARINFGDVPAFYRFENTN